jgi:hypothetical protein
MFSPPLPEPIPKRFPHGDALGPSGCGFVSGLQWCHPPGPYAVGLPSAIQLALAGYRPTAAHRIPRIPDAHSLSGQENTRCLTQSCGSGSRLDPDSETLWIRIRIGNPDPGSGSRGKKIKKFQWKSTLFSNFFLNSPLKRYKIALTTFWKSFWWITAVFLIWFDSNSDFNKNLSKKLSSKVLF